MCAISTQVMDVITTIQLVNTYVYMYTCMYMKQVHVHVYGWMEVILSLQK